jgi:Contractile injection system tube protein
MNSSILSQGFAVATLIALDAGKKDIIFQFAPPETEREHSVGTQENSGSNDPQSGRPKVSFKSKEASVLSFSTIFDTFEEDSVSVYDRYLKDIEDATTFIPSMKRPGVYRYAYKDTILSRCFVTKFSYKFTMFHQDGTPARAVVNLSLKEADEPTAANKAGAGAPNPGTAARTNPQQGSSSTSLISSILYDIGDFFA